MTGKHKLMEFCGDKNLAASSWSSISTCPSFRYMRKRKLSLRMVVPRASTLATIVLCSELFMYINQLFVLEPSGNVLRTR